MKEGNSRKKAIKLLKLGSAAIVYSCQKNIDQIDAVQKGNIFFQQFVGIISSLECQKNIGKLAFKHQTTLNVADFISEINIKSFTNDISCQKIDDKVVSLLANDLNSHGPSIVQRYNFNAVSEDFKKNGESTLAQEKKMHENEFFDYTFYKSQSFSENPFKKLKITKKNQDDEKRFSNSLKICQPEIKNEIKVTGSGVISKFTNSFTHNQVSTYLKEKQWIHENTSKKSLKINEEQQIFKIQNENNEKTTNQNNSFVSFKTGRQELELQTAKQNKPRFSLLSKNISFNSPPFKESQNQHEQKNPLLKKFQCPLINNQSSSKSEENNSLLKGFEKAILERIEREIISNPCKISWKDIVGLDNAKQVINESITIAINYPEFFTGLRSAPKAILFFGPPGTGKTLIGKCIASSCSATFMSISASSLTSKWIGESETLVRAMFTYARLKQPSVIFFDEIDSLLEARDSNGGGGGNETFNRIKTEFLVQLDGVSAMNKNDRVLFIAATNLPHKIDEAIIRRFAKRIYVPLPIQEARVTLFKNLLMNERHRLVEEHFSKLGEMSNGYSGSDITQVCKEAAMKPLRKVSNILSNLSVDEIPPISFKHFIKAFRDIKPSVSAETIKVLEEWNVKYGFSANLGQSDEDSNSDSDY